ncbi:hypothetical protein MNBD_GAMMA15-2151 [hydrothermal vent metagenome]|uniref:SPOR domain-containing protein n=1 Tax=hydrothermal vent metagenome TaxID=652676 RepID=A0A3B0Y1P4_9ZZZZ
MRRNLLLLLWLTLPVSAPGHAGSPMFDAGQEAYLRGDIPVALTLWRPLAKHGEADAQFALGTLYFGGIGVPVDLTESSYWFLRAAEQGYAPAQYNLGNAYKRGEGVRKNLKRAIQWWSKAAEQGLAAAQFNLAMAYFDGAGVPQNTEKARSLYQQSADNGHYPAVQALERLRTASEPAASSSASTAISGAGSCAEWLGQQNPDHFTLQLMSSTARSDAQKTRNQNGLEPAVICAYEQKGTKRYMLIYGSFPDTAAAQQAISNLPARLRQKQPWVRRIRTVSAQLR